MISGGTREAARQSRVARRRQHVIRLVALAAVARLACNRNSVHGLIVVAVALAAAARLAREGGNPLDRYLALGRGERVTRPPETKGLSARPRRNSGGSEGPLEQPNRGARRRSIRRPSAGPSMRSSKYTRPCRARAAAAGYRPGCLPAPEPGPGWSPFIAIPLLRLDPCPNSEPPSAEALPRHLGCLWQQLVGAAGLCALLPVELVALDGAYVAVDLLSCPA